MWARFFQWGLQYPTVRTIVTPMDTSLKEYQIEALDSGGLITTVNIRAYDAEDAETTVANDPMCKQVVSVAVVIRFKHIEVLKRYEVKS